RALRREAALDPERPQRVELGARAASRLVLAIPDPGSVRLYAVALLGPDREGYANLLAFHVQASGLFLGPRVVAGLRGRIPAEQVRSRRVRFHVDIQVV